MSAEGNDVDARYRQKLVARATGTITINVSASPAKPGGALDNSPDGRFRQKLAARAVATEAASDLESLESATAPESAMSDEKGDKPKKR
jgi:hypothetical protein